MVFLKSLHLAKDILYIFARSVIIMQEQYYFSKIHKRVIRFISNGIKHLVIKILYYEILRSFIILFIITSFM